MTRAALIALALDLAAVPAHGAINQPPSGIRTACVAATAGGAWAVTWATPFRSASYGVQADALNTGAPPNQTMCSATARTAGSASGTCSTSQSTVVSILPVTVQPFVPVAAGVLVCVTGIEPTQ